MKSLPLTILVLVLLAADASGAPRDDVPLPRPRPTELHKAKPSPPHAPSNPARLLDTPVKLIAVPVGARPGASVRLPEEPMLACRFAERLGHFFGDLAAPLIAGRLSFELKGVRTGPGYECRNRNRATSGHISAHSFGIAIDVASFELANGKALLIKPDGDTRAQAAITAIRTAACGWFTTVLGPGSDAAHSDHMHLDILTHGSSDRVCIFQWRRRLVR